MPLLIGITVFLGCIWLLGAMFSGSTEGGTEAVKGCCGCLVFLIVFVILMIGSGQR